MKDNSFTLAKARNRRYPAQTITDAVIVLLANTPTQARTLLYSLEQAAGSIDLYVNADKTEYTFFNQRVDLSSINGGSLKLVDKFTYLESSISTIENVINT